MSTSLDAATLVELGREAGDVEGGFAAWRAAGLPVAAPQAWQGLPGMGPPDQPRGPSRQGRTFDETSARSAPRVGSERARSSRTNVARRAASESA